MSSTNLMRTALAALLLSPVIALAAVGKVTKVEGEAHRVPTSKDTRKPNDGATPVKLAVGDGIELNDRITVADKANLKLTLNDGSVVIVGPESTLYIDEASFEGQERKGFGTYLEVGRVWAKVKKAVAGSNAKFEVTTERAVAGVRGTIFRVDALKATMMANAEPTKRRVSTVVQVKEGKVAVADPRKYAQMAAQGQTVPAKGPRKQVAGPEEISADAWEKRFVLLKAGRKVTVGPDLWEVGRSAKADNDEFDAWIRANGD